jgi:23S rRNA pseudouridine2604 synthase
MNVQLDVPLGKWRHLTPDEFTQLNELIAHSSKTVEDSSEEMD